METATVRVALVQARAPARPDAARDHLVSLIEQAAAHGATLVATPEGSNLLQRDRAAFAIDAPQENDPAATVWMSETAARLGVTLLIGSALLRREGGKAANRSLVFGPDGELIATYDKIHLFDVNLGAGQETRESDTYTPGDRAVVADTPAGRIGLGICYDMRFPHLHRDLARAGAQIIALPSAFTVPTGRAHWHVLLRARAIETGTFVIAPAQGGLHEDGRSTYGHSLVINPWGEIVGELDHDKPGVLVADLDLSAVTDARRRIPALAHDRSYSAP